MKIFKDWHFWVVVASVVIATIPQLSSYLPKAVVDIVLVILNAILLVIKNYQTKEAYVDGLNQVLGSKYK